MSTLPNLTPTNASQARGARSSADFQSPLSFNSASPTFKASPESPTPIQAAMNITNSSSSTSAIFVASESDFAVTDSQHRYASKYSDVARSSKSKEGFVSEAQTKWSHLMATKKVAMWIRRRAREGTKLKPVVKTLKNLQAPEEPSAWKGPRRYLCDRCLAPCPGADVTCRYCNIVLHESCLTKTELMHYMGSKARNTSGVDVENKYVCEFCREDRDADSEWYNSEKKRLWEAENAQINAALIGRVLRGFLSRFRYRRNKKAVVKFQAIIRRYLEHRKFKLQRKAMKRPMVANVLGAHDMFLDEKEKLDVKPYVVMTVHDPYHKEQILRFDTTTKSESLEFQWKPQNFLIPGVSGNDIVVFTVFSDDDTGEKQFLGQCALHLSQGDKWLRGGTFDVDLEGSQYEIRKHNSETENSYDKMTPQGYVTVQIKPLSSLHSVCGPIEGPHTDVLGTLSKANRATAHNISKITQKMNYWGVVANGELLVYRRFGDKSPKITCSLENLAINRVKVGGRAKLSHSGSNFLVDKDNGNGNDKDNDNDNDNGGGGNRACEESKNDRGGDDFVNSSKSDNNQNRTVKLDRRKTTRKSSQLTSQRQQHIRQFSLTSNDLSSSKRQKNIFEAPTVREFCHWYEVIEYWVAEYKKAGKSGGGRGRGSRASRSSRTSRSGRMRSKNDASRSRSRSASPVAGGVSSGEMY